GLRTFLSHRPWSLHMDHLLEPLLHAGSCLRVLALCDYNITKLPDSIGDLKYLRYLELDYCTELKTIPETICNLYNLKTLMLRHCIRLTRLPTNIGNLSNLQHLLLPPTLEELPLQIGKLTGLQMLNTFIVGEKNMSGGLKQLKELQNLHGTLHIWGLENVAGVEDGLEAVLKDKKFLTDLSLSWKEYADYLQKEKDVLDALEPHATLMELSISYYPGTSFPNWVGDQLFSNIVKVTLYKCRNCSVLPPLGQLSSLKDLRIVGFLGVKEINSEFYYASGGSPLAGIKPFRSLESLRFEDLSILEKWSFMEGKVEGGVFPCLKELRLRWCMRLKSLPGYFPSLRLLDIEDCEQILPLLPRGQQMDVAFPSLKTLNIFCADGEELLVEGGLPTSLKEVRLKSCHNLTTLDEEAFQCLTSLEKLDISHCFNIRCLPRGLPTSLSDLSIKYCDLLMPRLHRGTGVDWPIIAHVPSINILGDGYSYTTDERNLRL
ncbi:LRR domain containing protein, partial [Trema orientale]